MKRRRSKIAPLKAFSSEYETNYFEMQSKTRSYIINMMLVIELAFFNHIIDQAGKDQHDGKFLINRNLLEVEYCI
jgi:hypothetical protein